MAYVGIRHGLVAFGLLGALVVSEAGVAAAEQGTVNATASAVMQPLEILPSGHPVVQVQIDGSAPKRFVVDTAASITTILSNFRAEMPYLVGKISEEALEAASGVADMELAKVGRLDVAGRAFGPLDVILLPAGPVDNLGVDGILGADIIADYSLEIDIPGRRWRMAASADMAMTKGMIASVPFVLDEARAPRLTVRINGIEVPAVLDTGARGTVISWSAAKAIGLSRDSPGVARGIDVRGATSHATPSAKARLAKLSIGAAEVSGAEVRIADLPVFKALGFELNEPAVILGIDMFANRRFVIDHPGLRLYISSPVTPALMQP